MNGAGGRVCGRGRRCAPPSSRRRSSSAPREPARGDVVARCEPSSIVRRRGCVPCRGRACCGGRTPSRRRWPIAGATTGINRIRHWPAQGFIAPARSVSGGSRMQRFRHVEDGLTASRMGAQPGPARRPTGPQNLTVASIVSHRAGRYSQLAWGTGMHPIRRRIRIHRSLCRMERTTARSRITVRMSTIADATTAHVGQSFSGRSAAAGPEGQRYGAPRQRAVGAGAGTAITSLGRLSGTI